MSDLDQVDTDPGPSIIWTGKVEVNSDLPILGVVQNTRGWDSGSMYAMPSLAQGSTTLYMPVAYRVLGSSGVYSRLLVANLSGAEATVDFRFYSRAGHMDYLHRRKVPGNGVKNVQMQLSPLASLGDDWIGSVYVTTNQPVVAIVDSLWAAGMERIATYNAIND